MDSTMIGYGSLALAIVSEVAGSTFLQKSQQMSRIAPTITMLVFYLASLFFLSYALKTIPLGIAYAIWAGVGIVLTAAVGIVVFGQMLDLAAVLGISLIAAGIAVIQVFSNTMSH